MKKIETFCPVRDILTHVGDKWPVLVMLGLHDKGVMRFSELARSIPDISQKMLASTLRMLEGMHMIRRIAYPEVPPRVEYALTELGESFIPPLQALIGWILDHRDECLARSN